MYVFFIEIHKDVLVIVKAVYSTFLLFLCFLLFTHLFFWGNGIIVICFWEQRT